MSNWVGSLPKPAKKPAEGGQKARKLQPQRRPQTSYSSKKLAPFKPVKFDDPPPTPSTPPPPPKEEPKPKPEIPKPPEEKNEAQPPARRISVYAARKPEKAQKEAPKKEPNEDPKPQPEPKVEKKESPPPTPPREPTPPPRVPTPPPVPPSPPKSPPPTPKKKKKKDLPPSTPGSPKRRTTIITTEVVHGKKGKEEIVTEEFDVEPLEVRNEDTRPIKHADTLTKNLNLFLISTVPKSEGATNSGLQRAGKAKAEGVEEANRVAAAEHALEDAPIVIVEEEDPYKLPTLPPWHGHKVKKHINFGAAIDVSNVKE